MGKHHHSSHTLPGAAPHRKRLLREASRTPATDGVYYVGVDVGTGSARAAVFDGKGRRVGMWQQPVEIWRQGTDVVEQSSEDIWAACCTAVRGAVEASDIAAETVRGIGFDATCSFVAVDARGAPVTVSSSGKDERNVIVWMDHRALSETDDINRLGHAVLRNVGGRMSPEMQPPRLMWLKRHLPESWKRAAHFFDLPDYLTYRATGSPARSLCSTTCKWTYRSPEASTDAPAEGWAADFFMELGLDDLVARRFVSIGTIIQPMGRPVGQGLSAEAAKDLGLAPGTAVGTSIIDAHAGGIGMLGMQTHGRESAEGSTFNRRLALIGGTSSCHMAISPAPRFIDGVWGPYYGAMVPDFWLNEGGQSATGALVDHVISSHSLAQELQQDAVAAGLSIYELLNEVLVRQAADPTRLSEDLHVLPYFHGNRSPRADATLRGMISGLTLAQNLDSLSRLYLATIQSIAHGTRHIVQSMNKAGYEIETLLVCGGGSKNPLFLQSHADATGCDVILPHEPEAVLLGSAMLGAVAAGAYADVEAAMQEMSRPGRTIRPRSGGVSTYHDAKHRVFQRMYEDQMAYREIMQLAATAADAHT